MNILYLVHQFYPEYSTGTEKVALNVAQMMQRCGHRVKVFTYSFYPPLSYEHRLGGIAIKEYVYESVPVLAFRYRKVPADIHFAFDNDELSNVADDLIRRERPDLVHVVHSMRVGELLKSAKELRIPYIMTLTDFFLICPKYTLIQTDGSLCLGPEAGNACSRYCRDLPTGKIPKRLATAREFLSNAEAIAAPSQFLADIFRREFGDLDFRHIDYGLTLEGLSRNLRRYKQGDSLIFCYAGSLNAHKGVHILIKAFSCVTSSKALLKIYGTKTASETYVNMLKTMGRSDKRIEFCGEYGANKIGDVFQKIDVLVVPSLWYENQPLVINEALACNVPVIVSDVGGMTERVKHNFNGFTFQMGEAGILSETIQTIVENPEILNRFKDNIARMTFPTVEQEAYAYEQIYKEALSHA